MVGLNECPLDKAKQLSHKLATLTTQLQRDHNESLRVTTPVSQVVTTEDPVDYFAAKDKENRELLNMFLNAEDIILSSDYLSSRQSDA